MLDDCTDCKHFEAGSLSEPCQKCYVMMGSGHGYGLMYEDKEMTTEEAWHGTDEERVDTVGSNGNTGDHYDMVNNPKHYKLYPDMEAIDIIRKVLTLEEFIGYCRGNSLKYRLRAGKKDNLKQDIKKAEWYEEQLNGK